MHQPDSQRSVATGLGHHPLRPTPTALARRATPRLVGHAPSLLPPRDPDDTPAVRDALLQLEAKLRLLAAHEGLVRKWQATNARNVDALVAAVEKAAPALQARIRDSMALHEYVASVYGNPSAVSSGGFGEGTAAWPQQQPRQPPPQTPPANAMVRDVELHRRLAAAAIPAEAPCEDAAAALATLGALLRAEAPPAPLLAHFTSPTLALLMQSRLMHEWLVSPRWAGQQPPSSHGAPAAAAAVPDENGVDGGTGAVVGGPRLPLGPSDFAATATTGATTGGDALAVARARPLGALTKRALALAVLHVAAQGRFATEVLAAPALRPTLRMLLVDLLNLTDDDDEVFRPAGGTTVEPSAARGAAGALGSCGDDAAPAPTPLGTATAEAACVTAAKLVAGLLCRHAGIEA